MTTVINKCCGFLLVLCCQAVASAPDMESCLHADTLGVLVLFKCVIRSGARQGATEPGKTRATPRYGRWRLHDLTSEFTVL